MKRRKKDQLVLDITGLKPDEKLPSIEIARRSRRTHSNVLRDIRVLLKINHIAEQDITAPNPKDYGKGLQVVLLVPYNVCVQLVQKYSVDAPIWMAEMASTEEGITAEKVAYELTKGTPEDLLPECAVFEPVAVASTGKVEIDFGVADEGATMSTDQIAVFLNRKRGNVLRDFRKFCETSGLTTDQFRSVVPYPVNNGAVKHRDVYKLPQNICFAFISKYNPMLVSELTLKWQEAERRHRTEASTAVAATRQEMFDVIDTGDLKLLRKFLEHQEKSYAIIEKLTTKLEETEVKLIEEKTLLETKLKQQEKDKDAVIQAVVMENVKDKVELDNLEPKRRVSELRVKLLNDIAENRFLKVEQLAYAVKKILQVDQLPIRPGVRPDGSREKPQAINQALVDLGYQIELDKKFRWQMDFMTGYPIPGFCRYTTSNELAPPRDGRRLWGLKITERAGNDSVYGVKVTKTLVWSPMLIEELVAYMRTLPMPAKKETAAKNG